MKDFKEWKDSEFQGNLNLRQSYINILQPSKSQTDKIHGSTKRLNIQSTFMAPAQLSPLETRFLLAGGGSGGWPRSSRSSSRLSRLPRSPCPEIGFSLSVSDFSALSREQTRNLKWISTWFTTNQEWSENICGNLALGCRQPCTQVFVQVFYQRTLAKMELAMMAWYRLESKHKKSLIWQSCLLQLDQAEEKALALNYAALFCESSLESGDFYWANNSKHLLGLA